MGRSVLAGDIGGTKTTLALHETEDVRAPQKTESYDSPTIEDFDPVVRDFLGKDASPARTVVCLAVAGPIIGQSARLTQLSLEISGPHLASHFGFGEVRLINDLEALGYAIPVLRPEELEVLQTGQADPLGSIGVLAPGTGLGESYLTRAAGLMSPHPSEGGHADFAPATARQVRLLESLWRERRHVSVERVCSGIGLPNLHRFVVEDEGLAEDRAVAAEIAATEDPNPVIVEAAVAGRSAACREAVELFCDILAAEAGNMALKVLATGGIFLGGGIPPRILPFLRAPRFREAFLAKGRFSTFLERVPVAVVLPSEAVLWGAALCGMSIGGGSDE